MKQLLENSADELLHATVMNHALHCMTDTKLRASQINTQKVPAQSMHAAHFAGERKKEGLVCACAGFHEIPLTVNYTGYFRHNFCWAVRTIS